MYATLPVGAGLGDSLDVGVGAAVEDAVAVALADGPDIALSTGLLWAHASNAKPTDAAIMTLAA